MWNRVILYLFYLLVQISFVWGEPITQSPNHNILKKSKTHQSKLDLSMRALTNENQFSKASVFDLGVNYFLNYTVNPYIFFNLNPTANLQSGHIQSIDANEKLENRLSILNAAVYFSWMPVSHYAIGIMNSLNRIVVSAEHKAWWLIC